MDAQFNLRVLIKPDANTTEEQRRAAQQWLANLTPEQVRAAGLESLREDLQRRDQLELERGRLQSGMAQLEAAQELMAGNRDRLREAQRLRAEGRTAEAETIERQVHEYTRWAQERGLIVQQERDATLAQKGMGAALQDEATVMGVQTAKSTTEVQQTAQTWEQGQTTGAAIKAEQTAARADAGVAKVDDMFADQPTAVAATPVAPVASTPRLGSINLGDPPKVGPETSVLAQLGAPPPANDPTPPEDQLRLRAQASVSAPGGGMA